MQLFNVQSKNRQDASLVYCYSAIRNRKMRNHTMFINGQVTNLRSIGLYIGFSAILFNHSESLTTHWVF